MSTKTYQTCGGCGKAIRRGPQILQVPPSYEIALGIAEIKRFHPSCAAKAGIDPRDVQ